MWFIIQLSEWWCCVCTDVTTWSPSRHMCMCGNQSPEWNRSAVSHTWTTNHLYSIYALVQHVCMHVCMSVQLDTWIHPLDLSENSMWCNDYMEILWGKSPRYMLLKHQLPVKYSESEWRNVFFTETRTCVSGGSRYVSYFVVFILIFACLAGLLVFSPG